MAGTMTKPPPTPMMAPQQADQEADADGRQHADVKPRAPEPHLERQAVDPQVGVLAAADLPFAADRRPHALDEHQAADGAEEDDVGDLDHHDRCGRPGAAG